MILQTDKSLNKIAHAVAFVDMYIMQPNLIDSDNIIAQCSNADDKITSKQVVRVLIDYVDKNADDSVKYIVISEMRTKEFQNYIRHILREK